MDEQEVLIIHTGPFGFEHVLNGQVYPYGELVELLALRLGIKVKKTGNGSEVYKNKEVTK